MHKTHIFDKKIIQKIFLYRPTYPILFRPLEETNNSFSRPNTKIEGNPLLAVVKRNGQLMFDYEWLKYMIYQEGENCSLKNAGAY